MKKKKNVYENSFCLYIYFKKFIVNPHTLYNICGVHLKKNLKIIIHFFINFFNSKKKKKFRSFNGSFFLTGILMKINPKAFKII